MYTVHWLRSYLHDGHHDLDSLEDLLMDHAPKERTARIIQASDSRNHDADWPTFGFWTFGFIWWMTKYVQWANICLS
jgi:hypothetical protein